mmetsp:Transcript_16129/g.23621  ORF Transcript_16129/g.23621 Transcript_16129/m.23621 type:complete len:524 (-) Transcript_16129:47-1618(-)
MKVHPLSTFLLAGLSSVAQQVNGEVVTIHGSGTTNPSKCIWHIMSLFMERSLVATRLTYRAVGSSTGQMEFLGVNNTDENSGEDPFQHVPHTHFGAGDIPVPSAAYKALNDATNEGESNMLHLPFALSSISFFHSIPGIPDNDKGLKLNSCLLARIFDGKITRWDDPEILALNVSRGGHLKEVASRTNSGIYVARRVHGSSSTASVTKYLHEACKNEWPKSKVGSELGAKGLDEWHVRTKPCEGSGGMTECLKNNPGAIGYLDSGHGWSEGLAEVNLQNKDEYFLTSRYARDNGGITSAASFAMTPLRTDSDWGNVHYINKDGMNTWPIVVMSYVYLRKDINLFVDDHVTRGLLKLFLESLYDDDYFGKCTDLGFSKPPKNIIDMAKDGLNNYDDNQGLQWTFPVDFGQENMWSFESKDKTRKIEGAGKYVVSGKRQSLNGLTIEQIAGKETELESYIRSLATEMALEMKVLNTLEHEGNNAGKVQAALVLGALSFTLWMCVFVGWLLQRFLYGKKGHYQVPS